ncbi:MAG TPA: hypothetical protein VGH92_07835 [Gaiellaceae bacterium]
MQLRLTAALLALAAGAAAVALAALLVRSTPGPPSAGAAAPIAPSPAPRPRAPAFPAPPPGAIVFAREDGANALALAVTQSSVQVSVVGPQGKGVSGLAVSVNGTRAVACGAGCYRVAGHARSVDVRVGAARWHVVVPAARDASALVARATRVWRSLQSLAFFDRLGSDATHVVVSHWVAVAPDRLSYDIRGGYRAVIVGGKRWDRAPGGNWVESAQTAPVKQPAPVWQSATDANIVGETGATVRITFFDPRTPAWFEILVDARTLRTLDLRMTTTAHFMHERYSSFDAPLTVRPPG